MEKKRDTSLESLPLPIRNDARLMKIAKIHGTPTFPNRGSMFRSLLRAIIGQQVSTAAAKSIFKKFSSLLKGSALTPQSVLRLRDSEMRSAGLSSQKVVYVRDLALKFHEGHIRPHSFRTKSNEEIIEILTSVRGVGVWTAHMLLIFTLQRENILPTLDLGIKKGFQFVYDLPELPNEMEMERIAAPWKDHASIASWYLWRAADDAKKR